MISRRQFLRDSLAAGLTLAVGSLAACAPAAAPSPTAAPKPAETAKPAAPAASAAPAATTAPAATQAPAAAGPAKDLKIYWHPGHYYEAYKAVWAKAEKDLNLKISVEQFQWPDMRTKLLAGFTAGAVPDLMEGGLWTQEFAKAGYLEPLDAYVAKDGKAIGFPDDWINNYPEQSDFEGKLYGIQLHLTCNTLVYNPKLLERAGVAKVPTTWAEFLAACQAVKDKTGAWGYAPEYQVSQAPSVWFWQNDVQWWDPKKRELTINSPAGVEALQFQADLVRKYKVAPEPQPSVGYEGPANLFIAEKVAMITTGPWNIAPIRKGAPNLVWDIAPPLKGKVQATYRAGVNFSISKDAKNKQGAWEIIKRMLPIEVMLQATKEAGMLFPRKTWAARPELAAEPIVKKWAEIMTSVPLKPYYQFEILLGEVYETMYQTAYDNAMFGKMTAQEALDKYVKDGNLKLKQNP
ncbi:MAG: extracellular solute-binding protein [Chloroflexi bacterium]|nr:extracellular solute-binding protein [Chloroflexota bacterium]